MAAKSDSKEDVMAWIVKVINSCETPLQMYTAYKLIRVARTHINHDARLAELILHHCYKEMTLQREGEKQLLKG